MRFRSFTIPFIYLIKIIMTFVLLSGKFDRLPNRGRIYQIGYSISVLLSNQQLWQRPIYSPCTSLIAPVCCDCSDDTEKSLFIYLFALFLLSAAASIESLGNYVVSAAADAVHNGRAGHFFSVGRALLGAIAGILEVFARATHRSPTALHGHPSWMTNFSIFLPGLCWIRYN